MHQFSPTPPTALLRLPDTLKAYPYSPSRFYELIREGLFVPPVPLGGRAVAWPEAEVQALVKARIAGKSDAEVRDLVKALVAARGQEAAPAVAMPPAIPSQRKPRHVPRTVVVSNSPEVAQ